MSVDEYRIYLKTTGAMLLDDNTYLNGKSSFKQLKEAALDIIENGYKL